MRSMACSAELSVSIVRLRSRAWLKMRLFTLISRLRAVRRARVWRARGLNVDLRVTYLFEPLVSFDVSSCVQEGCEHFDEVLELFLLAHLSPIVDFFDEGVLDRNQQVQFGPLGEDLARPRVEDKILAGQVQNELLHKLHQNDAQLPCFESLPGLGVSCEFQRLLLQDFLVFFEGVVDLQKLLHIGSTWATRVQT